MTAQKREQDLQDVPIAITALDSEALQANRVATVQDLSGLAPGVLVTQTAGASRTPSFTIRGVVSTGVVPGSDKQVSLYLDDVYLAAPRGAIFDLPDLERIEVLRAHREPCSAAMPPPGRSASPPGTRLARLT